MGDSGKKGGLGKKGVYSHLQRRSEIFWESEHERRDWYWEGARERGKPNAPLKSGGSEYKKRMA